ncbi:MAG TPA: tetratricopeptide repeat protein [Thermoanaerobaculia bacterium]|nr:tetratricopeptide repeat protein [Thermoanaerobaculia bacterium]
MRRLCVAIAALLMAAAPARSLPPPQEPWIEVKSANFTLFGNAGEWATRQAGEDLERLRDALLKLSPGLTLNAPSPTWIYVFKSAPSMRPYQRLYEGKPLDAGGYFLSRPLGNYVAVDASPGASPTAIIYHEYFHYVARNNYGDLPVWLHEGLAEYYSTFEVTKSEARIGLPIREHLRWLRKHSWIPLAQLFAVDQTSKEYNETDRRGAFYAESWALTHYLLDGNPQRRAQFQELLRLTKAGTPGNEAFQKVFGADPSVLERELHAYINSYTFDYNRIPIQPEANLAMTARPMARQDVLFRLGDFLSNLGAEHYAAAEEHFRAALAIQPDHSPSLAGLGVLAEQAHRPEEARSFYEKAAKLAPDDFLVQYRYAENLLDDPRPDSLRTARAALTRAVALRPDFGEAWARLGYTYQAEETMDEDAVHSLEMAHRLLSSRMDVVHNLALAYARTGHRDQAAQLIEQVLAPHGDPDEVLSAREALLDEDYRHAEELVTQEKPEEALPLLERVRDGTRRPERRRALELRIDEIQKALDFNRFVAGYNQAVELANRGDVQGAVAILEPLVETVRDPTQAEQARKLLEKLKPPAKRRGGGKPR